MSEHIKPSKPGRYLDAETWDALKAVGFTDEELSADTGQMGPVIFAYTRAQAIEDGVLVDVSARYANLVKEAGFKVHIAMTATSFHDAVLAGTTENERGQFIFPPGQSAKGRLWDVLMVLHWAIKIGAADGNRVDFSVKVDSGRGRCDTVKLYSLIGPGDEGEPVLTIMLPDED